MIQLKRACDKPAKTDGLRMLVERLWPRGMSKKQAAIDLRLKDAAPSTAVRNWFNHDPDKWSEFQRRYRSGLKQQPDLLALLKLRFTEGPVTFVYAASDTERNSAAVLKDVLQRQT